MTQAAQDLPEHGAPPVHCVGPNAIIQLAAVLRDRFGEDEIRQTLADAGLGHYATRQPDGMTDEREAAAFHRAVMADYPAEWDSLCREAGVRTAEYLLAYRIPQAIQLVLKVTPPDWAAKALRGAITRHSWTFAGSGHFTAVRNAAASGCGMTLVIATNPLAMPGCPWHCGVFSHLFTTLVTPRTEISHTLLLCSRGSRMPVQDRVALIQ